MATKTEITGDEIKHLTGWNEVTFKLNLTKGVQDCRTGNDLYDARKFVLWYRNNVVRPQLTGDGAEEQDMDIISHRARYEKARAQKYQIKLEKLRAQYVPLADAEFALMEMCEVFNEIVELLPELLAKEVHGKNEDEMLVLTDQLVRGILLDYSKLGDEHGGD